MIKGLLFFVIATKRTDAAHFAQCIQFVDEDDARCRLARLFEQVMHSGGAYAHEHFDKLGPRYREKRHAGFTGDGFGHQGLAGSRRADQQSAFGDMRPQA
ncbi:hypothetical protein D9M71_675300 [compost metagenome]